MSLDSKANVHDTNALYVTILAGGLGKRMNSDLPKVLHTVHKIPMIIHIIWTCLKLNPVKIIIVVGAYYHIIRGEIEMYIKSDKITYCIQEEALGTGDAVKSTIGFFSNIHHDFDNLILNGDVPLLRFDTIRDILAKYMVSRSKLLITAIRVDNPHGFGRIFMDHDKFVKIIEEKDCSQEERHIQIVNCGIYLLNRDLILNYVPLIQNHNSQHEYYLTDIVSVYNKNKDIYLLSDDKINEIYNVNTVEQLEYVNSV